ncbi:MAG: lytic murein transglycosylase [Candidatus Pacebacteria bacterium]|nr:lytic murein transglycosylase [Candidatus Paceibacterota bacterium]
MSKKSVHFVKFFIGYIVFFVLVLVFLFFAARLLFAQSVEEVCKNPEDNDTKALCDEYARISEEEKQLEGSVQQQKAQSASIQTELSQLTTQIKKTQLSIDKKNIEIKQLSGDINLRDQTVKQLNAKLERGKEGLSQLIKRKNELDDTSLVEIILSQNDFSEFFVTMDSYNILQSSLEKLFTEIRDIRGLTEEEKAKLERRKAEEQDVKAEIESQKKTVQAKEKDQSNLLSYSKKAEATLESYLAEKRARATQIRTALFRLRDTAGISFGDAVKYAQTAGKATGVRPALILAILKQESDLGNNVGTCNRAGDPDTKKYTSIMPGPLHYANYVANGNSCTGAASPCSWRDDQSTFKDITTKLGLDYNTTPLSCPIASVGGWGGAMGPSQFIPTTWKSYEGKIASALGISTPNPWNPEHAFTATALYLRDLGAANGGYTAEHTAAAKYYAGNNYASGPGQSYGTSVLSHASGFQEQIDFLSDVD